MQVEGNGEDSSLIERPSRQWGRLRLRNPSFHSFLLLLGLSSSEGAAVTESAVYRLDIRWSSEQFACIILRTLGRSQRTRLFLATGRSEVPLPALFIAANTAGHLVAPVLKTGPGVQCWHTRFPAGNHVGVPAPHSIEPE